MREKELEQLFKDRVKKRGGKAYKFVSPGTSGVPDRLVILPGNKVGFVELKAPGKKSSPEQCYQQRKLEDLGCYVAVIDSSEMIDVVIREIQEHGADCTLYDISANGRLL